MRDLEQRSPMCDVGYTNACYLSNNKDHRCLLIVDLCRMTQPMSWHV